MLNAGTTRAEWGEVDGRPVYLYTLTNRRGMQARLTNYGGILTELHVPDKCGELADVVLGFDSLDGYLAGHPYFGAVIGRVANRIARGRFTLDGEAFDLATNDGPNHLHGGDHGFDKRVWQARPIVLDAGPALALCYISPDGEEGYPGNLRIEVIYTLTDGDTLTFEVTATTDRATPVSITNHTYWNLAGHGGGNILDHTLMLMSDLYTPADDWLVPTGDIRPVKATPFDFRRPKAVGADIDRQPVMRAGGYDTNFLVNGSSGRLRPVACLRDEVSGRTLKLASTQAAVQFYSGHLLDGSLSGKGGAVYRKHAGLALEPQASPNAVNIPHFPSVLLRPGAVYRHVIEFAFSAA